MLLQAQPTVLLLWLHGGIMLPKQAVTEDEVLAAWLKEKLPWSCWVVKVHPSLALVHVHCYCFWLLNLILTLDLVPDYKPCPLNYLPGICCSTSGYFCFRSMLRPITFWFISWCVTLAPFLTMPLLQLWLFLGLKPKNAPAAKSKCSQINSSSENPHSGKWP